MAIAFEIPLFFGPPCMYVCYVNFCTKTSQLCLFQHFRATVQTKLNIILKLVQNGTLISLFF